MKKFLWLFLFCIQSHFLIGDEGTVVGIHGILGTNKSLAPMETALECAGLDVRLFQFESRQKTIQEIAAELCCFLNRIAEEKPGQPINFAAHSIGSLILRSALNNPCCPCEAKIGRAVLLAPPNKGSKLARRFKGFQPVEWIFGEKIGWQLMTFDECSIIQCLGDYPSTLQIFVIAGSRGTHLWFNNEPNDEFITVDETKLNTPYIFCIIPVTHSKLLTSPVSLELTRNFILYGFYPQQSCCQ